MDLRERADWRGFRSMFLPGMPVPPKGVDGSSRHFCCVAAGMAIERREKKLWH